jgi:excinuclease ABC subunit A
MNFLPDVYVPCEVCHGARYNRRRWRCTSRARRSPRCSTCRSRRRPSSSRPCPAISRHLSTLVDVGLGYVRLGQPAPTLSGGEAQRVKLASELQKRSTGRTVYVLDEPTTGLHFEDISKLLVVLQGLADKGNTVIVIEHNLDVIKTADWVVDMGPEGGSGGGTIVAEGTPEQVAAVPASHTGVFLKDVLQDVELSAATTARNRLPGSRPPGPSPRRPGRQGDQQPDPPGRLTAPPTRPDGAAGVGDDRRRSRRRARLGPHGGTTPTGSSAGGVAAGPRFRTVGGPRHRPEPACQHRARDEIPSNRCRD